MDIKTVMTKFAEGATSGKASSVSIEGDILYSYATALAERLPDGSVIVNRTKYSQTTSRQQTWLAGALADADKTEIRVSGVPRGAYSLQGYVTDDSYKFERERA